MSALDIMSPAADHYTSLVREAYALKLVDAMVALEQAVKDADKARKYCSPDDQQKCELAVLDARVEVYRLMSHLEIDARIVGGALA